MQKIYTILLAFCLLFVFACDEIPPDISNTGGSNTGGGDTTLENQKRQVMVEEFTGVRCINCPEGSTAIENLLDVNGDQLIAVSIHAGFFSPPYPQNQYDFQTTAGDNILNYLGQPQGYPTAVIDRKLYGGESSLQVGRETWAGYVAAQLQEEPSAKIAIDVDYTEADRTAEITVTILVEEDLNLDDPRLTLMITENNIVDAQLTPESSPDLDLEYVHKHVLRDLITNFDGNAIEQALTAGTIISEPFAYTVPEEWKEADCSIIAFLNNSGSSKEIIQAEEVHLIE